MEKYFEAIKRCPIFADISSEEIKEMLNCLQGKKESYEKGSCILQIGDKLEAVGLLLSGKGMIVQEDFWGNRNILSEILPGHIFGEAFACSPGSVLNVSVFAEKESEVLWLSVGRILTTCPTACPHHSRMIRNLLSDLAEKNLRLNEKLTHMGQRKTREKLMSYLSSQAQKSGKSQFEIPFNRQQLADYLSVERSAMSLELSKLKSEGIIDFDKNSFKLL